MPNRKLSQDPVFNNLLLRDRLVVLRSPLDELDPAKRNGTASLDTVAAALAGRLPKLSPNHANSLSKAYRLLTRAEIAANGGLGEAFEDLDYATCCINTRITVEFYQPDPAKPRVHNQVLVAVYDPAAPADHYVHTDGSFKAGDLTPAKFVPIDSEEAKYGYVRRYAASITDWALGELTIFAVAGKDYFATAKKAGGPLGQPDMAAETADWKPAAAPVMGSTPGTGTPGTARDPYDVPAAKREAVVDAGQPLVTETDEAYYGKRFGDDVYGPDQPAFYQCLPFAPAQDGGATVWKWVRTKIN